MVTAVAHIHVDLAVHLEEIGAVIAKATGDTLQKRADALPGHHILGTGEGMIPVGTTEIPTHAIGADLVDHIEIAAFLVEGHIPAAGGTAVRG